MLLSSDIKKKSGVSKEKNHLEIIIKMARKTNNKKDNKKKTTGEADEENGDIHQSSIKTKEETRNANGNARTVKF